jgi:uncharacterized protein (TIGR00369 family)
MNIWKKEITPDLVNKFCEDTLVSHLNINITQVTENSLIGTMPVDKTTKQPLGILHGGANCVIAESLGSIAANFALEDPNYAVGLNISTQHIKAVRRGLITAVASPVHLGRTTHIWNIDTFNEAKQLTSTTRLTMMIMQRD